MTENQLQNFINTRNESPFSSNFQFQVDMEECGISKDDLGDVNHLVKDGQELWTWNTPFGKLNELAGVLSLVA